MTMIMMQANVAIRSARIAAHQL